MLNRERSLSTDNVKILEDFLKRKRENDVAMDGMELVETPKRSNKIVQTPELKDKFMEMMDRIMVEMKELRREQKEARDENKKEREELRQEIHKMSKEIKMREEVWNMEKEQMKTEIKELKKRIDFMEEDKSEAPLNEREVNKIRRWITDKDREERKANIVIKRINRINDIKEIKDWTYKFLKDNLDVNSNIIQCKKSNNVFIVKLEKEEEKRKSCAGKID